MKLFKIILTITLSVLLVASVTLNIILFKSSYASLLIRYDQDMFLSLADKSTDYLNPSKFLQSEEQGIEIYVDYEDSSNYISYYFYVDEISKLSAKIVEKENNNIKTTYLINNSMYVNDESHGTKTVAEITSIEDYYYVAFALTKTENLLDYIENNPKEKAEIDFTSKYLIGFEYEAEINDDISYTYHFDLKGNLRTIDVDIDDSNEYKVTITSNSSKIEFPDFSEYTKK